MHVVVVLAHPCADSFSHALAGTACTALREAGHDVTLLDLYALGVGAAMSPDEHRAYMDSPSLEPTLAEHAALVRAADTLVFVYPTWWSSLPAILKGWLERVLVPGVAFVFDHHRKVRPGLTNVRRIVGISTYGSPRAYVTAVNDNGRRILTRALRLDTGWRTRTTWLGLYGIDTTTDEQRRAFVRKVDRKLRAL